MRVIANSIGLISEDFEPQSIVEDSEKLYSGFAELVVDDQLVEQFYNDEEIIIPEELAFSKNKIIPSPVCDAYLFFKSKEDSAW